MEMDKFESTFRESASEQWRWGRRQMRRGPGQAGGEVQLLADSKEK